MQILVHVVDPWACGLSATAGVASNVRRLIGVNIIVVIEKATTWSLTYADDTQVYGSCRSDRAAALLNQLLCVLEVVAYGLE